MTCEHALFGAVCVAHEVNDDVGVVGGDGGYNLVRVVGRGRGWWW